MDGRYIVLCILITCCAVFLSTSFAPCNSRLSSSRADAFVVAVWSGNDASQCLGIQEVSITYHSILSKIMDAEDAPETITQQDTTLMNIQRILHYEEGYSDVPYLCSMGYVTIGNGTKLCNIQGMEPKEFPIRVNREISAMWMQTEISAKIAKLLDSPRAVHYFELSPDRQDIIISMAYQMGVSGVLKFHKMWYNIAVGNLTEAAEEMMDSKWAVQTPQRAERHKRVMLGEPISHVYPD